MQSERTPLVPVDTLAFQLYSARFMTQGLEAQFALIAGLGYRRVEAYAALLDDPDRLRGLLDRHGMTMPTIHVGLDRLRDDPRAAAKACRALGVEVIFAPAPPPAERGTSGAGWRALGRELAAIGEAVTGEGVDFGWHNHDWEFARAADGTSHLDAMFAEAPDLLWEVDAAWILRAGADPLAEIIRRHGRVIAAHIKDRAPAGECADEDGWADPGHGTMDWPVLLAALRDAGARYFVVEHDRPNDVARFARRARDAVAGWG
jgi:sugar phosphate isomerase/epimerase